MRGSCFLTPFAEGLSERNPSFHFFWLSDMNGIMKVISLVVTLGVSTLWSCFVPAEQVVLTLSQEQDGGDAGRACMYIHQGKAEYRVVQPQQACPATLTVDATRHSS